MKKLIDIINEDSQKLKNRKTLINSIRDYCDNNNWNEFIATMYAAFAQCRDGKGESILLKGESETKLLNKLMDEIDNS